MLGSVDALSTLRGNGQKDSVLEGLHLLQAPKSAKSGDRVAVIPYGTPNNVKYALVPIDYRIYTECGYYGGH